MDTCCDETTSTDARPSSHRRRYCCGCALFTVVIGVTMLACLMYSSLLGTRHGLRVYCAHCLQDIAQACKHYAIDSNGYWPFSEDGYLASLSLLADGYVDRMDSFSCARDYYPDLVPGPLLTEEMCSYDYLPGLVGVPLRHGMPAHLIVLYDELPRHTAPEARTFFPKGRNVLLVNGDVMFMLEHEFRKRFKRDLEHYTQLRRSSSP